MSWRSCSGVPKRPAPMVPRRTTMVMTRQSRVSRPLRSARCSCRTRLSPKHRPSTDILSCYLSSLLPLPPRGEVAKGTQDRDGAEVVGDQSDGRKCRKDMEVCRSFFIWTGEGRNPWKRKEIDGNRKRERGKKALFGFCGWLFRLYMYDRW